MDKVSSTPGVNEEQQIKLEHQVFRNHLQALIQQVNQLFMKKLLFFVPVALIVLTSYYYLKPVTKINIQPLGAVSPVYINQIKKSVKSFYGFDCVVLPSKSISKDIISKIKKRIDGDKNRRIFEAKTSISRDKINRLFYKFYQF